MTLEINLDEAAEEITLVLDNHLVLTAHKENDIIMYGKAFGKIGDDDTYTKTKKICKLLLTADISG